MEAADTNKIPKKKQAKNKNGRCNQMLKKVDVYGVPVSLVYKKEPFIKSTVGGVATVLARVAVVAYLGLQC